MTASRRDDSTRTREHDELAEAHVALERQAGRQQALFDVAPVALVVTDLDFHVRSANAAADELLETPRRALLQTPLAAYVDPAQRHIFGTFCSDILRRGGVRRCSVRMRRRHGGTFEASLRANRLVDEAFFAIVDQTEHQRRQQTEVRLWELNRELERLTTERSTAVELLLEELPAGVVIVDKEGQPRVVNRLAARMLGLGEGTLDRSSGSDLDVRSYDGSPLPPERWPPARALEGETVRGERVIVERADGMSLVLDVSAAPLTDPRRPLGAIVIFTDVTEREQEERSEREFVENAAHQLRSPITAIASAVGALEAGAKDHPAAREQFITHVAREAERMARLADTLLLLTRFQQRRVPPATRLVQLAPLLEELVAAAKPRPGVRVTLSCDGRLGALCHPGMVREAIDNVIRNAIEHTTSGPIRVGASHEGDVVVVEVADSGPGIPPEARERVFERFFQVGYGPKPGAGLGLAIAAEAIAANGGRLELLPTPPGTGATFRFTLPGALLV